MVRVLAALCALMLASAPLAAEAADPVTDGIYPAPRAPLSLDALVPGASLDRVETADGLTLQGVTVPGRADRPLLLMFHGNGSSASDAVEWLRPALDSGFGMVAAEYRGYSANPGRPNEAGLAKDADAWMARARTLAAGRPIWIVGHSLGGGVALSLADRAEAEVVVTIGTFTRLRDMVDGLIRAIVPDAYRNLDRARTIRPPWFIVHGLADDVVPASHGQRLHAIAGESGRTGASLILETADHHPDGATIAALLEAIRTRPEGGLPSADALPAGVLIIPFGQTRPLERGVP